nr:larval cuticle protein 1-like [Aedes albopictus]
MSYEIMLMAVILSALVVSGAPPVVVNQYNQHFGDEYAWGYTLNDTQVVSQGIYKKTLDDGKQVLVSSGSYSFSDGDGIKHTVVYTADENGFHPKINAPWRIPPLREPATSGNSITTTSKPTTTTKFPYVSYANVEHGIDFKCLESLCGKK